MYPYFEVTELSAERWLREWRWLCPMEVGQIAVNAFGDLFLQATDDAVARLDMAGGAMARIAASLAEFQKLVQTPDKRREWFLEDVEMSLRAQGSHTSFEQCYGYKIPLVFAESSGSAENVYIADLYEYVSFLGNLHKQLQNAPDRSKVRLNIGPKSPA